MPCAAMNSVSSSILFSIWTRRSLLTNDNRSLSSFPLLFREAILLSALSLLFSMNHSNRFLKEGSLLIISSS